MAHAAGAGPPGAPEQGSPIRVEHDRRRRQFTVRLNGCHDRAVLLYEYVGKRIVDLQHTEVPDAYRGRGIAKHLAKVGLEVGRRCLPTQETVALAADRPVCPKRRRVPALPTGCNWERATVRQPLWGWWRGSGPRPGFSEFSLWAADTCCESGAHGWAPAPGKYVIGAQEILVERVRK
uniref:Protein NATD1 n=1 Tax=Equus asinus TaxID=9793 RepID=A0A9L0J7F1_EQUAS